MNMHEHYLEEIKLKLQSLETQLREDAQKLNEAKAQTLFETSAEVLQGLQKAFDHYENTHQGTWDKAKDQLETRNSETPSKSGGAQTSSPTHG